MRKGLSGAEIIFGDGFVTKRGAGVAAQGYYAAALPSICPAIYSVNDDDDSYTMELLTEPDFQHIDDLHVFKSLLSRLRSIWELSLSKYSKEDYSWRVKLLTYAYDHDLTPIMTFLPKFYSGKVSQCLIHGDPTLANVLFRNGRDYVICDPIRPVDKIPGLPEVDWGKMLQSILGWEYRLGIVEDRQRYYKSQDWITKEAGILEPKMWFWCMVHLFRTLPYLKKAGLKEVEQWVLDIAWNISDDLSV